MRAGPGQFTASACHFVDWDNTGAGSPAIQLEAGKAIVQGCTFNRSKLHVSVASNVVSAILTGNQAEDGFRVKNAAGRRVQSALNEENTVAFPPEARQHYEIAVGKAGDGRYLENFHDGEKAGSNFRWSSARSRLILPVIRGTRYHVELGLHAPGQARGAGDGLYLNGQRLVPLPGEGSLRAEIPPASEDQVELELRCNEWLPTKSIPGSQDNRSLGVQVYRILMKAEGTSARLFEANTGTYP